jgi:putative ABC transport system permease protein
MIRYLDGGSGVAIAVRNEVLALDKEQPVYNIRTLDSVLSESVAAPRFRTLLLAVFAGMALLLAAVGIYGVISYAVSQRTQEIGIRMALGAQASDVLKLIVKGGMTLVLIGVARGLAGAFAITRLMTTLLFGVQPTDVATFAVVSGSLIAVALMACLVPARRATKVDPLVALRYE